MQVVDVVLVERARVEAWTERLASTVTGRVVTVGRHCPVCGSTEHGRPVVIGEPDVYLSLTRTGAYALVAAARVPIGIDAELAGRVGPDQLDVIGVPESADPTQAWVAAEATGKLTGHGLTAPAIEAMLTPLSVHPELVAMLATHEPVRVVLTVTAAAEAPGDAATA